MTASEEHTPERRRDERRKVSQPPFFGENRSAVRRTDDVDRPEASQSEQSAEQVVHSAIPRQDYDFLTGLISMEHSG